MVSEQSTHWWSLVLVTPPRVSDRCDKANNPDVPFLKQLVGMMSGYKMSHWIFQ